MDKEQQNIDQNLLKSNNYDDDFDEEEGQYYENESQILKPNQNEQHSSNQEKQSNLQEQQDGGDYEEDQAGFEGDENEEDEDIYLDDEDDKDEDDENKELENGRILNSQTLQQEEIYKKEEGKEEEEDEEGKKILSEQIDNTNIQKQEQNEQQSTINQDFQDQNFSERTHQQQNDIGQNEYNTSNIEVEGGFLENGQSSQEQNNQDIGSDNQNQELDFNQQGIDAAINDNQIYPKRHSGNLSENGNVKHGVILQDPSYIEEKDIEQECDQEEDEQLVLNFECCKNCQKHNWMVWHDEKWYHKCYIDVKKFILKMYPNAIIEKNKDIEKPAIGSFEIRHKQNLIWSKKKYGEIPKQVKNNQNKNEYWNLNLKKNFKRYTIASRVQSYLEDLKNKNDVQKYACSYLEGQADPQMRGETYGGSTSDKFFPSQRDGMASSNGIQAYKTGSNFRVNKSCSPQKIIIKNQIRKTSPLPGGIKRLPKLSPSKQQEKEIKIFEMDENQKQFVLDFEVCQNCHDHNTTLRHNPKKYNFAYENLKNGVVEAIPSAIVQRNRLSPPRIGAFEIKHQGKVLYSKLQAQNFPKSEFLIRKIKDYKADYEKKQNGEKVDLNQYVYKRPSQQQQKDPGSPKQRRLRKINKSPAELLGYEPSVYVSKRKQEEEQGDIEQELLQFEEDPGLDIIPDPKVDLSRLGVDIINGNQMDWSQKYIETAFQIENTNIFVRLITPTITFIEENPENGLSEVFSEALTMKEFKSFCIVASKCKQEELCNQLEVLINLENVDQPDIPRYKEINQQDIKSISNSDLNEDSQMVGYNISLQQNSSKKQKQGIRDKSVSKKMNGKQQQQPQPSQVIDLNKNASSSDFQSPNLKLDIQLPDINENCIWEADYRKLIYTFSPIINKSYRLLSLENQEVICTIKIDPPYIQIFQPNTQPLNEKIIQIDEGLGEQIISKDFNIAFQKYAINAIPINIECHKLLIKTGTIPQVQILTKLDEMNDVWSRRGKTEQGEANTKNVVFFKKLWAEIHRKDFKFDVLDVANKKALIGQADVTLSQLINEKQIVINIKSSDNKYITGQLSLTAQLDDNQIKIKTVTLEMAGIDLKGNRKYDDLNPFLKIVSYGEVIYVTETCKDTLEPSFLPFQLGLESLCQNDFDQVIEIQSWNYNKAESYKLGSFCITMRELMGTDQLQQKYFQLMNNKREVGVIQFKQVRLSKVLQEIPNLIKEDSQLHMYTIAITLQKPSNLDVLIDCQLIMVNQFGEFIDFVSIEKPSSNCGSLQHFQWTKKESIYSQEISINFDTFKPHVHGLGLFICSRKGHAFHLLKDITVEFYYNHSGQIFYKEVINLHKNQNTGVISHIFSRGINEKWGHHYVCQYNSATNFTEGDVRKKLTDKLNECSMNKINYDFAQQCRAWNTSQPPLIYYPHSIGVVPESAVGFIELITYNPHNIIPCLIMCTDTGMIIDLISDSNKYSKDKSVSFLMEDYCSGKFDIQFDRIQDNIFEIWLYMIADTNLELSQCRVMVNQKDFINYNFQNSRISKSGEPGSITNIGGGSPRNTDGKNGLKKYDFKKKYSTKSENKFLNNGIYEGVQQMKGCFAISFRREKTEWSIVQRGYFTRQELSFEQEHLEVIIKQILKNNFSAVQLSV